MPKTKFTYLNTERVNADVYAMAKDQSEFARKYDFTRQVLNDWLNGGLPSTNMLQKFMSITGRSRGYYTSEGKPSGKPPALKKQPQLIETPEQKPFELPKIHKKSQKAETPEFKELEKKYNENALIRIAKALEGIELLLDVITFYLKRDKK